MGSDRASSSFIHINKSAVSTVFHRKIYLTTVCESAVYQLYNYYYLSTVKNWSFITYCKGDQRSHIENSKYHFTVKLYRAH